MLALSPPQFCSVGWLLDDPISHEHEKLLNNYTRDQTSDEFLHHSPNSSSKNGELLYDSFVNGGPRDDNKMVKKLNHNASERDRRKRINTLYSTLRSLLPQDDQSKKLSIPATVSRMVKYIPEVQKEVERLIKKKESLRRKKEDDDNNDNHSSSSRFRIKACDDEISSSSSFSATQIGDREIVIQSSMLECEKRCSFSEAVMRLEEEGFLVTNATSFRSFEGRVFYNLHLQAQGSHKAMDTEMLKKKMWL